MGLTVTVQDETRPGSVAGTLTREGIPVAITLRELIRTRVRGEVARANASPRSVIPSEAFMLADDAEIDDPAIARQISRRIVRRG